MPVTGVAFVPAGPKRRDGVTLVSSGGDHFVRLFKTRRHGTPWL